MPHSLAREEAAVRAHSEEPVAPERPVAEVRRQFDEAAAAAAAQAAAEQQEEDWRYELRGFF